MDKLEGLDEEFAKEEKREKVVALTDRKNTLKQFHIWTVDGEEHKMKLNTSMIIKLENKYRTNVANLISSENIPPLSVMLTIMQAGIAPWEHGTSYSDVQKLYDKWQEADGGNQQTLFAEVLIPLMAVSGFFTEKQSETILENMREAADLL